MAKPKDSRPKDQSQPKAKPNQPVVPPMPPDDPQLIEIQEKSLDTKNPSKKVSKPECKSLRRK